MQQLLDELVDAGAAGVLMHYRDERGEWRGSSGVAEVGTDRPVDPVPGLVPDGNGIKLRQLLNHTAGLYNYTDDLGDTAGIVRERFVHWDPRRAVGMATAREPLFAPGTSRSYSAGR